MSELRILTVRQPWAWAIIHGGKDVENRTRDFAGNYRGPVAIHVAQREELNAFSTSAVRDVLNAAADRWYDQFDPYARLIPPWREKLGHIIGVVDLVDVHGERPPFGRFGDPCCTSPWGEHDGGVHLVLANPRPVAEPIPYKGALGLRRLEEETTAAVWSQIGERS